MSRRDPDTDAAYESQQQVPIGKTDAPRTSSAGGFSHGSQPRSQPMNWHEPNGWPADANRDRLIGDWHIYQRRGGHRTSTDDVITAWYAVHRSPGAPARYLDLGCGVGSVMLMVCHRLRPAVALGIEAQAQSVAMARRAIDELPPHALTLTLDLTLDLTIDHVDFREADFAGRQYDLITGSPPYFPLNAGVLPDDPQRRACRFEARGGVEVYLETAARALSEVGRCYLVHQTRAHARVLAAATRHGLALTGQADFLMRSDRPQPFLSVFEFARQATATPHRFRCAVREPDGRISAGYQRIREELGVS